MKYYQCKNQRKIIYAYLILHILVYGLPGMVFTFDFTWESSQDMGGGIFFLLLALIGIAVPIYMKINRIFERTVEITKDEVIYREKNRTVKMKWDDVTSVALNSDRFFLSWNRLVVFAIREAKFSWNFSKVNNKRIWSEYNDQMIEEIKQYWHGVIYCEDSYRKYKSKKKHISHSGDYKYKQIFGNDDNRYFRFEIRPNALIYDKGDYAPKLITNEAYYTRFTTIFGWGENDTLWIYSSDTGIDYWEIEDGMWGKKRADEGSIKFAPERIREMR